MFEKKGEGREKEYNREGVIDRGTGSGREREARAGVLLPPLSLAFLGEGTLASGASDS